MIRNKPFLPQKKFLKISFPGLQLNGVFIISGWIVGMKVNDVTVLTVMHLPAAVYIIIIRSHP